MAEEAAPLNYKRTRLVELLQEKLQEREDERAAEKAKRDERNADAIKGITEALSNERFLVYLVNEIRRGFSITQVDEKLPEHVEGYYGQRVESDYDEQLKQLIRVFENADDDLVQVDVTSDVYRYL